MTRKESRNERVVAYDDGVQLHSRARVRPMLNEHTRDPTLAYSTYADYASNRTTILVIVTFTFFFFQPGALRYVTLVRDISGPGNVS